MSNVLHGYNWKDAALVKDGLVKTICDLGRPAGRIASTPGEVTCSVCGLRLWREAQALGLALEDLRSWTWANLGAPPLTDFLGTGGSR